MSVRMTKDFILKNPLLHASYLHWVSNHRLIISNQKSDLIYYPIHI
jgi:hypothetical protein